MKGSNMKLTNEEKRIKIAEACGLNPVGVPFTRPEGDRWFTPEAAKVHHRMWPRGAAVKVIPDYFNDLNAMRDAEVQKREDLEQDFAENLIRVVDGVREQRHWSNFGSSMDYISASAAQRAEAFGLTLNLWQPGE
jgi:hypothetical protein